MKNKKLAIGAIMIASATLLSACTPPEPETDDLSLSGSESYSLKSDISSEELQYQETAGKGQMPQEGYKSLEDFKKIEATQVVLTTTKGEVFIDLFTEKAPLTTANFLNLIDEGFYDGIVMHRVVPDFVVQFGDPQTKTAGTEAMWGTGGPGYRIMDEFHPELKHDSAGILSMANSGPNTGGSQVFITLAETNWLDGKHAVFGKVSEGMDVVSSLTEGDKITKASYR